MDLSFGRPADADMGDHRGDHQLNPDFMPEAGQPLVPAAVLVPLVDRPEGLTVLLTQRTDHLEHHPGQVSFPGGHIDRVDTSPEDAALREAEEEIGLMRERVRIVGRLDDYLTRTGFRVVPVVGFVEPPFDLNLDPFEVAEAFEVPLDFLLDPRNHRRDSRIYQGKRRYFHAMPYDGFYIWGATAGMLMNLYEFLRGA
ncbi:MAG: CoA pyrophosphatase [Hyphomicrobiales bacterium]|nr:CoA pyrophosphatase [Hyphomicrobiales bacterium]MCP5371062.1 CoA pyrophosphatase [Hyphomicrobiales bacterium]